MNQSEVDQIRTQQIIALGLRALSMQSLTVFALILDAAIFGWALATESYVRLGGAVLFSIASWCLLYLRPRKES